MAQSNNTAATITKASGSILVERDGQAIELKQGDSVFATDTIKTQGSAVELTFTDGAKAMLSPETTMTVQEFAYGGDDPSFVLNLVQGTMRSISGKVVEQNPDAFKVVTPKATVGIRGTDFVDSVAPDQSQTHFVLALNPGHTLVLTTHDGQQLPITSSGQGAFIGAGESYQMTQHNFNQEEINDILGTLNDLLNIEQVSELEEERHALEDEKTKLEEERNGVDDESDNDTDTNQVQVLLDQDLLESLEASTSTILGGLAGSDSDLSLEADSTAGGLAELEDLDVDDDLLLTPESDDDDLDDFDNDNNTTPDSSLGLGGVPNTGLPVLTADGSSDFFGDMQTISGGTHVLGAQRIELSADMSTDVVISGDALNISGGANVTGGDDEIMGQNMAAGTVVGDAETVDGSTLIGGNDTIVFNNKTGGNSIYGDAEHVTNAVDTQFGDDSITLNGNFTASIIAGDVNSYAGQAGANVSFGDDDITINGNVSGTAAIYGDDVTGAQDTEGGDDSITVTGTFDGIIEAGGGADDVSIGTIVGGRIDLGANDGANDSLSFDSVSAGATVNIENFDAGSDKLFIGGQEQQVTGSGNYGGLNITFTGGNTAPSITAINNLDVTEDAAVNPSGNLVDTDNATASDLEANPFTFGLSQPDAAGNMASSLALLPGTLTIDPATGQYDFEVDNNAVQYLGAGESIVQSVTIYVADNTGAFSSQDINITINGADDIHSVAVSVTDGNVTEAGIAGAGDVNASGSINISDVDTTDTYTLNVGGLDVTTGQTYYVVTGAGGYTLTDVLPLGDAHVGSMTFSGSGKDFTYNFTLNNNNSDVNALGDGASLAPPVSLNVAAENQDGVIGNVVGSIDITVNGSNDGPTVGVSISGLPSLSESGTNSTTGTISVIDPESGGIANSTVVLTTNSGDHAINTAVGAGPTSIDGTYGRFVVNADGTYTYTLYTAADGALYNTLGSLASGSIRAESFSVTATDPASASATSNQVNITISGTNNAPIISDIVTSVFESGVGRDASGVDVSNTQPNLTYSGGIISGNVGASDIDTGATLRYTFADAQGVGTGANLNSDYGTFTLDQNGGYSFTLNENGVANALGAGDSVTLNYTITVTDDAGVSTNANVSITINGTNDKPTLSASSATDPTDGDLGAAFSSGAVSGTATVTDIDDGDSHTFYIGANSGLDPNNDPLTLEDAGSLTLSWGSVTINANGVYTYTADNRAASIPKGSPETDSFTIYVKDADGAWAEQTIEVTVTGQNQAPTITANSIDSQVVEAGVGRSPAGALGVFENTEYGGDFQASGTLTVSDADPTDTLTVSVTGYSLNSNPSNQSAFEQYGDLVITAGAGGVYTYTFTLKDNSIVNALAEGDRVDLVYTVQVSDGTAVHTDTILVNIHGTNDKPTFTLNQASLGVTEDDLAFDADGNGIIDNAEAITASGNVINIVDPDNLDSHDFFVALGAGGNSDVETGPDLTVTTKSVNDAWGTFAIDNVGQYTFTLDNNGAVQGLGAGDSQDIYFTVYVKDNAGAWTSQVVTVTVTGANDAPAVNIAAASHALFEEGVGRDAANAIDPDEPNVSYGGVDNITGTLVFSDVDGDALTYTLGLETVASNIADDAGVTGDTIGDSMTGSGTSSGKHYIEDDFGTFTFDPTTGEYEYTLNQLANTAVSKLKQGDSITKEFTITAADPHGGTVTSTITITINGTNDKPSLTLSDATLGPSEDGAAVTGTANILDADVGDTHTFYVAEGSAGDTDDETGPALNTAGLGQSVTTTDWGTFSIDNDPLSATYGQYTFTVDNNSALVQALGGGGVHNLSYTIYVKDAAGAWTSQVVNVTITGADDAPLLTLALTTDADVSDDIDDGNADREVRGNINITDADIDVAGGENIYDHQKISATSVNNGNSDAESSINSADVLTIEGQYGNLVIQPDGSFVYTLGQTQAQLNALDSIDEDNPDVTDVFNITSTDASGLFNTVPLTINVRGDDGGSDVKGTVRYPNSDYHVNDTITLGNVQQDGVLVGDDATKGSTGTRAGSDSITVDNVQENGIVVGDIYLANPGNPSPLSGGDDTITLNSNLQGTAKIYGDSSAAGYENATAGADIITVNGNMQENSIIFGDNQTASPETTQVGGIDTIQVKQNMDGGTIYGAGGNDIITIGDGTNNGDVKGTIYGGTGNDTITVNKLLENGTIYGNEGADIINVNVEVDKGIIDLGVDTDKDIININTTSSGVVTINNFVAFDDTLNINGRRVDAPLASGTITHGSLTVHFTNLVPLTIIKITDLSGYDQNNNPIEELGSSPYLDNTFNIDVAFGGVLDLAGDKDRITSSNQVAGDDIINLNLGMTGGAVYGDTSAIQASGFTTGSNTITVTGDMTGGEIHGNYGIIAGSQSVNLSGSNSITVTGSMSGGTIVGGHGTSDKITVGSLDGGNITGGTYYSAGDNSYSIVVGSMSSGTIQGAQAQVSAYGGNDNIYVGFTRDASGNIIDANGDMSDGTIEAKEGNDSIILGGDMIGGTIYGGVNQSAHVANDGDTIAVQGEMRRGSSIYGDTETVFPSGNRYGDDDSITVNSLNGGSIYGDTGQAYGASGTYGNDTITITNNASFGIISGDVNAAYDGYAPGIDATGNDTITINGNLEGATIYGDAATALTTASISTGGDIITVKGNMTSGNIYGDVAATGEYIVSRTSDNITIEGVMSGGAIYGGEAGDTIIVGSVTHGMTGGAIYGDYAVNSQAGAIGSGTKHDAITVYVGNTTNSDDIIIRGGEGNDTIQLRNVAGAQTSVTLVDYDANDTIKVWDDSSSSYVDVSTVVDNAHTAGDTSYTDPASNIVIYFGT